MNPVEQPTHDYPNPLSNPRHWWHKRGPRTEAEVDHFQAWKFQFQTELEHVVLVQDRYPDLAGELPSQLTAPDVISKYRAQRELAIGVGRVPPSTDSLADLDAAADVVRNARDGRQDAYARGREAFLAALQDHWPYREWAAWGAGCAEAERNAGRIAAARRQLGLRGGENVIGGGQRPSSLAAEIDKATGGSLSAMGMRFGE